MTTPPDTPPTVGDDPHVQWQNILRAAHSDAEQARIDAATHFAEATLYAATRDETPTIRTPSPTRDLLTSGSAFSRVALMWHRVLTDTDAFIRSRASDATVCRFDPTGVRAWLTGPDPSGDSTVAESLGIGVDFDIYGFDKWERISSLLAQAQQADFFGVPDHEVGVLHLAGERGYVDRHRVTLHTPQHGLLCSDDLDTEDLMADYCGVDAAVHVLEQVARAADRLLYQRAVLADVAWPSPPDQYIASPPPPQPLPGKAFRPLATVNPDTTAPTPASPTAPATTRRHR